MWVCLCWFLVNKVTNVRREFSVVSLSIVSSANFVWIHHLLAGNVKCKTDDSYSPSLFLVHDQSTVVEACLLVQPQMAQHVPELCNAISGNANDTERKTFPQKEIYVILYMLDAFEQTTVGS